MGPACYHRSPPPPGCWGGDGAQGQRQERLCGSGGASAVTTAVGGS